ncbi:MAG: toll/interleukin-1 receptor domain-containing protein [Hyphomonas sp.]
MAQQAIFISYRRSDTGDVAGRLCGDLQSVFGVRNVFKDHAIPPGTNFGEHLVDKLKTCRAVLVLIGPDWEATTDEAGARRLDDPTDWVRLEVETALAAEGVHTIPVLVNGAQFPSNLPSSLAGLLDRQAMQLRRDPDYETDAQRIVDALRRYASTLLQKTLVTLAACFAVGLTALGFANAHFRSQADARDAASPELGLSLDPDEPPPLDQEAPLPSVVDKDTSSSPSESASPLEEESTPAPAWPDFRLLSGTPVLSGPEWSVDYYDQQTSDPRSDVFVFPGFSINIFNATGKSVVLASAIADVALSTPDPEPMIGFESGRCQNDEFAIVNDGWGEAKNVRFSGELYFGIINGRGEVFNQEKSPRQTRPTAAALDEARADAQSLFRQADIKGASRVKFAIETLEVGDYVGIVPTAFMNVEAPNLAKYQALYLGDGTDAAGQLVGVVEYEYTDAFGQLVRKRDLVEAAIDFGGEGCGGGASADQMALLKLMDSGKNYQLGLPIGHALADGDNYRIDYHVTAPSSSFHDLKIVTRFADGRERQSPEFRMKVSISRAAAAQARLELGDEDYFAAPQFQQARTRDFSDLCMRLGDGDTPASYDAYGSVFATLLSDPEERALNVARTYDAPIEGNACSFDVEGDIAYCSVSRLAVILRCDGAVDASYADFDWLRVSLKEDEVGRVIGPLKRDE